jgi:hypothetical protein
MVSGQSNATGATGGTGSADPVDVVLVRWPEEGARLERLRASGVPRLLLVGGELGAPASVDPLEDWIRLPAAEDDLRARVATLTARAGTTPSAPSVDGDGLLRHRGQWVTLSPVERALAAALVDRFGRSSDATRWCAGRGRAAARPGTRSTCTCCAFVVASPVSASRCAPCVPAGTCSRPSTTAGPARSARTNRADGSRWTSARSCSTS